MPTYSHRCPDCNDVFDVFRAMASSENPSPCPKCGVSSPKIITAPFIDIKGNDTDQARRKSIADEKVTKLSARARDLGNAGFIPKDDPIVTFNDKRLDSTWTPKEKPKDPA